jgi:outer membrane protein OmpA-like peptidoglycan-associated protein
VQRDGEKLVMVDPIVFEPKAPALTDAGGRAVDELATFLAKHPEITHVSVEAHAEKLGPLTKQMAQAVVDRLVGKGIAPGRLEARGMGGAPGVKRRIELRVAGTQ